MLRGDQRLSDPAHTDLIGAIAEAAVYLKDRAGASITTAQAVSLAWIAANTGDCCEKRHLNNVLREHGPGRGRLSEDLDLENRTRLY